jgi:hypothetical protein
MWAIKAEHPKLRALYWQTHGNVPNGRWVSDPAHADKFATHREADELLVEVLLPDTSGEWFLKAVSSSDEPESPDQDGRQEN